MYRHLLSLVAFLLITAPALGQLDGTQVYRPLPKNMNILALHKISGDVNATFTSLHQVQPNFAIENDLYLLTYSRSQPILGRSFVVTLAMPAGTIKSSVTPAAASLGDPYVHGIGDPSIGATINLFGAPGLMLREYARYDLKTVVSLNVNGTFPLGQYDGSEPLNIGSNQSKLRLGLPIVKAFGPWVPGDRTTLEVMPSVTLVSDNNDVGGQTRSQEPLLALESHLTRDITRNAGLSLDYSFLRFGESATSLDAGDGESVTPSSDAHLLGATFNFKVNDNMTLYATHMQTVGSPDSPVELEGSLFRVTLTWAFHRVIERRRVFAE